MSAPRTRAGDQPDAVPAQAPAGAASGPREQCDLIMQGGITSGIVYPAAVAELHERYDFRSIGGASAGAIGAALTAAAQYGDYARRRDPARPGGFGPLSEAAQQVATPGLLVGLFQPTRATAWAFGLLFGLQRAGSSWPGRLRVAAGWVARYFAVQVLVAGGISFGALVGVLYGFGGSLDRQRWYGWLLIALVLLVASLLGLLAAVLVRALITVRGLPAAFFGACSGMPAGRSGNDALTPWLHGQIQRCAGREGGVPLTFADLAGGRRADEKIALEMMTTDLSAAQPLSLPFAEEQFLYSPGEFARLFPDDVLAHLERVSTPVPTPEGVLGPTDLRTFPGPDLPVIVATRMSLSFPGLICAVPLWVQGIGRGGPVRHWFSDGGISSNFPMHFFDTWLPTRPTFGLDLVPTPRAKGKREPVREPGDPAMTATVAPPSAAGGEPVRRVAQINNLFGFLGQILDTTLNWRDTLLAELPGFSDRIRSIRLPDGTGGIHLTMTPAQINDLAASGAVAGQSFLTTFDWDDHLFARYTLLMRQLQQNLVGGGHADPGTVTKAFTPELQERLLRLGQAEVPGSEDAIYDEQWGHAARDRTLALLGLATGWAAAPSLSFIQGPAPTPPPVMRMRPKV
ncbi:patatin-like phospholipase family protein [Frankia sp. AgB1.9]|uniref:patatin-like phospholipase family protein n=1 Tax=unclassified Frankia TaxID=2632575 RepID=UPI00193186F2|nr:MULTISPECIES: patatin-like phospholipase family protein [unclassified Frankia]MBL7493401.1 patatin-like phospholipase family protein [Frankia sp. AgW1.1]MBL7549709.1 patatin-like phospholipase family protein [Frankia sp. AgB1.9]MBL7620922.1 patatin-like phospholipase family protein [Frankia sp. AgB1.8]